MLNNGLFGVVVFCPNRPPCCAGACWSGLLGVPTDPNRVAGLACESASGFEPKVKPVEEPLPPPKEFPELFPTFENRDVPCAGVDVAGEDVVGCPNRLLLVLLLVFCAPKRLLPLVEPNNPPPGLPAIVNLRVLRSKPALGSG